MLNIVVLLGDEMMLRVHPIYPAYELHSLYKLPGIEMRSWSEFSREIRNVFWSREFRIFIKTKTCLILHSLFFSDDKVGPQNIEMYRRASDHFNG